MSDKQPKKITINSDTDHELEHRVDVMMSVEKLEEPEPTPVDDGLLSPLDNPDDDPTFDPMVDDIVAQESDELLERSDADAAAAAADAVVDKPGFGARIGNFFKAWWHNKLARYATIFVILAGLIALGGFPATRYYALNLVGVRSGASLTVVDSVTQLPLKNVTVELGKHTAKTNQDGLIKLSKLELGTQALSISQTGFATVNETVTLGFGSNPLGDYKLQAIGLQFRISVVDYLSGKPVKTAEINSDESNAKSDSKGLITLTVDHDESATRSATVSADGYRDERLTLKPGQSQNRTVQLVPGGKHTYISKQSGKYDLYKIDIDGKNKKVLLAATGNEDSDITLAQSTDGQEVAMVSKRDTLKNQDGFVLQSLTLVNVEDGANLSVEHSEQIRLIDWVGTKIVYIRIKAGTSAGSPDRYQLISYDYTTNSRLQLASSNNFNHVISAGGTLYYAASNNYQGGVSQFARIKPDNTGKSVLLDKTDVWDVIRSSYDTLSLVTDQNTYSYKLGDSAVKSTTVKPSADTNKFFLDNDDATQALWFDSRDGKGVLLADNVSTGKDTVVTSQDSLVSPLSWHNARTAIYRVSKPDETADYAVSLDGGQPKKIVDVTPSAGLSAWNY